MTGLTPAEPIGNAGEFGDRHSPLVNRRFAGALRPPAVPERGAWISPHGPAASAAVAYFTGWPILIGLDPALFAISFAAAVGVFFGWYPASQAARLTPVEALRAE